MDIYIHTRILGWVVFPLVIIFVVYELSENCFLFVAEMYMLSWGAGGDAWKWQQSLFAWEEEMLGECCLLFHKIVFMLPHFLFGVDKFL